MPGRFTRTAICTQCLDRMVAPLRPVHDIREITVRRGAKMVAPLLAVTIQLASYCGTFSRGSHKGMRLRR